MSKDKGRKSDSENSMHDTKMVKGKKVMEKHVLAMGKAKKAKPKMKKK